ncbi:MAG: RecQ family ATP-dependent DNA helicase [Deltaproteobacteria bacterium]
MSSKWNWAKLRQKAFEYFGIEELRPGQKELIEAVMNGKNALGVMPTGAGKSLCYQLPALFLPKATIVVTPLISLMHDQTHKLEEVGVDATHLDSTLSSREEKQAVRDVKNGQNALVYVTPERLENPEYLEILKKGGVSLLVVDEAHCVSQWGHDFRPAYLSIRKAIEAFGNPPVLALTATATPEVERDILEQLNLKEVKVCHTGVDRKNLVFEVYRTVNAEMKFQRLTTLIHDIEGTGIVYVSTVRLANELHAQLLKAGIIAGKYHGKMKMKDRDAVQEDFMANRYRVIVATKAFGLGIDKPDVRFVIHYTFPDSVESYYQEAGRAGRDGKKAIVALLYRLEDKRVHSFFLGGKYPTRSDASQLYSALIKCTEVGAKKTSLEEVVSISGIVKRKVQVLIAYLEKEKIIQSRKGISLKKIFLEGNDLDRFLTHYEERLGQDRDRIQQIMKYGQTTECRATFFRDYFGEKHGEICRKCDNCRGKFLEPKPASKQWIQAEAIG